jgi:hypothetical protein
MVVGVAAVAALAFGCGGAQTPSHDGAHAAMRGAHEAGAEGQPRSAYYLQLARDQCAIADQMTARGATVEAKRMLMRAQADAELAIALADEGNDRADAEELGRHISDMRRAQL